MRPIFHPNIYEDGDICISILHKPGEDEVSGELASERWSPAQRAESVLISILSLLDDAETSSPANVEAGVLLRRDLEAYKAKVRGCVEQSKKDVPEGFVMPTFESTTQRPPVVEKEDPDFWADSDDGDTDSDEDEAIFDRNDSSDHDICMVDDDEDNHFADCTDEYLADTDSDDDDFSVQEIEDVKEHEAMKRAKRAQKLQALQSQS